MLPALSYVGDLDTRVVARLSLDCLQKKKHCDYLLSDRQGIIALNPLHWFNLLMIFKSLIDIEISVASEKRLVIIVGALCRYSSRTIPNQIVLATDLTY